MTHDTAGDRAGTTIDRRALLRRGGAAAAAGLAAYGAASVAVAGPAEADSGDPALLGQANTAGADPTSITSTAAQPTLKLSNTGTGAPFRLEKSPVTLDGGTFVGGELANVDGELYYTAGAPGNLAFGFLYSEYTATQVVPIVPQRVLDTRSTTGRALIVDTAGRLDALGRLDSGKTIEVDLLGLASEATAAFVNVTAVLSPFAGYLTVFGGGTLPGVSSLNFTINQVVANFAVTAVSGNDTVSIYASRATHVLLDVFAFAVGNPAFQIDPAIIARRATGLSAARARGATATQRRRPPWRTSTARR